MKVPCCDIGLDMLLSIFPIRDINLRICVIM